MAVGNIKPGDSATHSFVVDAAAMALFQEISGDLSLVHTDKTFAQSRGFDDVIVYGGLMLAHLSYVVGQLLPGEYGASAKWSITYRAPLYVGERATIKLDVRNVSTATGFVQSRYKVMRDDTVIAEGETQSIVPRELIDHEHQEHSAS